MNENWSKDFATDFTDNGFDVEENGSIVTGQYRGKFVVTQFSRWFDDMLHKIETEHKILRSKTFFNSVTGNASFEVEIDNTSSFYVDVSVNGKKIEYYPTLLVSYYIFKSSGDCSIYLDGRLESGQRKTLGIRLAGGVVISSLGVKERGVVVDKSEIRKIYDQVLSRGLLVNNMTFDQQDQDKAVYIQNLSETDRKLLVSAFDSILR